MYGTFNMKPHKYKDYQHQKETRRCGSVSLGVVVLRVRELCYVYEGYVGSAVVLHIWLVSWDVWSSRRGVILEVDCQDGGSSLWGSNWVSTWGCFYWMLVIESNSVNSGTEVLIENICIKWHVLQTYCFPLNEDCTLKKILTRIFSFVKDGDDQLA